MKRRSFLGLLTGAVAGGRQATAAIVSKAGIDMTGIAAAAASGNAGSVGLEVEAGSPNVESKDVIKSMLKLRGFGFPPGIVEKAREASKGVRSIDVDIGSLRSVSPAHMLLMQRQKAFKEMTDIDGHIRKLIQERALKTFNDQNKTSIWFW